MVFAVCAVMTAALSTAQSDTLVDISYLQESTSSVTLGAAASTVEIPCGMTFLTILPLSHF